VEGGVVKDDFTLIHGDCLHEIRWIESNSIDCLVTDPPYGIGESGKKNKGRKQLADPRDYGDYKWDVPLTDIHINELLRVSEDQVLFGGNFYAHLLPPSSSWIVWDKLNTGDFADCELAWTSHKKAVRKFTWLWNGMIKQHPEKRYHPTQKPLALMKWILENYTAEDDLILDPFMGSGTTGVACHLTNRRFIGIEIDKDYYDIATRRIAEARCQTVMPL
jgi:DNA modification methylase